MEFPSRVLHIFTSTDDSPRVLRILRCTASTPHGHWWSSSWVLNALTGTSAIGWRVLKIVYTGSLWQITQLLFPFSTFIKPNYLAKRYAYMIPPQDLLLITYSYGNFPVSYKPKYPTLLQRDQQNTVLRSNTFHSSLTTDIERLEETQSKKIR